MRVRAILESLQRAKATAFEVQERFEACDNHKYEVTIERIQVDDKDGYRVTAIEGETEIRVNIYETGEIFLKKGSTNAIFKKLYSFVTSSKNFNVDFLFSSKPVKELIS